MWEVEYTDEFCFWWNKLTESEQVEIAAVVNLLERLGPKLQFPFSSSIEGTTCRRLRELRIQYRGMPYRVLYAFDPRRTAILLLGGNKKGNNRWYETNVPMAEKLYQTHIFILEEEEEINV
ncbi:MAG: type II toxin-antitoxin system RelE/ParE family toxin [Legionella sp.]|nr:type II toxin-antitoxin system RelE/ParE family toxin [Legionella sp.]